MDLPDVWRLDATAQAELVRRGDVAPLELLEAAIARIEVLNPALNAVVIPLYELARERAASELSGVFAGVPMLVKDACLEVEGTPHYIGMAALREAGWRSRETTELARRFDRAGFVIAGKTNVPALSAGVTTEPPAFGPTRNPWDPSRSPGGSSGGSAAAVASGMVSIAHGSDGTGSLRYPAALCGVATLKPSRGRVPSNAAAGQRDDLGVWTEFVLARSVRDLSGVLACAADRAPDAALAERGRRVRIAVLRRDVMTAMPVDPTCVAAVDAAASALVAAGYEVEEAHPPSLEGSVLRAAGAIATVGTAMRAWQWAWLTNVAGREVAPGEADLSQPPGRAPTGPAYGQAVQAIRAEFDQLDRWFRERGDVLLTPVTRGPAWLLGEANERNGATLAGVFPAPWSFGGQPAMSLPLHWTPDGLPAGVQAVAGRGRDEMLLGVAAELEAALPWAGRWPDVTRRGDATDPLSGRGPAPNTHRLGEAC